MKRRKAQARLERRRKVYDQIKDTQGTKRPGSYKKSFPKGR